ncbi:LacI family DNA-binding transcriptional regulator [Pararhodobacter oceanensis]|uniref:LacI family DNA-binding transcriptional regulator n=1 Tax=Pararhodobacter oceanensis TaxID=2172121 RepID=UPI003A916070
MVTIKDIGRKIGMSHATVSRALNNSPLVNPETFELVQRTAREMGYFPDNAARALRGSASNIVGFVLPDINNHFYSRIASVVGRHVADRGLQLVLATSDEDPAREERHLVELQRARARAIVITPTSALTKVSLDILRAIPTTQMVRRNPALATDLIAADDGQGVAQAVRHLLSRGHQRIAYIGGGPETLSTGSERLQGYLSAMQEGGVSAHARYDLGPPQPEFGRAATERLLRDPARPEAIVLGSSQLTIGFLDAVRAAGLSVPQDLSFTGYDDPDWFAHWGAGITTVGLPIDRIASTVAAIASGQKADSAAQNAVQIEMDTQGQRDLRFACALIERGTVRRI